MSTISLIITILLVGFAGAIVVLPLLEREPDTPRRGRPRGTAWQEQALETLYTEKARVLRSVRDLDFDYDLGKLPDAPYADQRIYLLRRAAAITQRIDDLESEIHAQEARLEEAITAYRQARTH